MNARFRKASALFASLVMLSATAVVMLTTTPAVAAPNPCQDSCTAAAFTNVGPSGTGFAGNYELGLAFHTTAPGTIDAISWYQDAGEPAGLHSVSLHDITNPGTVCAPCGSVVTGAGAGYYVAFFAPQAIVANDQYVASFGATTSLAANVPTTTLPGTNGTLVAESGAYSLGAGSSSFTTGSPNDYLVNVEFWQAPVPAPVTVTRIDNTHASVAFKDDGSANTSYTITCVPSSGPNVVVGPTTGLTSPRTVTLVSDKNYNCTVSEVSPGGTGSASTGTFSLLTTPTITAIIPVNAGLTVVSFSGVVAGSGETFSVTCTPVAPAVGATVVTGSSSGSPINVTGLTNDIPYSCTVTKSLATGLPPSTTSAPFATKLASKSGPGCTPTGDVAAPTKLSAASMAFPGAVVSWAPVTTDCLAGYLVIPSEGTTAGTPTFVAGAGTTTHVLGLTLGKTYTFTVSAVTGKGAGPASDPVGPITIGTPAAVTSVHVAHVGKGAVKVAFKAGANNGAAIKSFTATCGSKSASGKASPLTVKGLKPGGTYTCTVTATNSRGRGAAARSTGVKA